MISKVSSLLLQIIVSTICTNDLSLIFFFYIYFFSVVSIEYYVHVLLPCICLTL